MNGNKHNVNDKLHCKHCGAELAEDSVFCEQCGKRVKPNKWLFVFIATALLLGVGGLWFYLSHRDEGAQPKPKPTYTISVKSSDEAMGTVNGGGTYDTIITATIEALANEGYRFVSWNDGDKERQRNVITDHNQEYEARFERIIDTLAQGQGNIITPGVEPKEEPKVKPKEEPKVKPKEAPTIKEKKYWFGRYEGDLKNGIPDGNGTMFYDCQIQIAKYSSYNIFAEKGDYFVGNWKNGDIYIGKLYDKNGIIKYENIKAKPRTRPYDLEKDEYLK